MDQEGAAVAVGRPAALGTAPVGGGGWPVAQVAAEAAVEAERPQGAAAGGAAAGLPPGGRPGSEWPVAAAGEQPLLSPTGSWPHAAATGAGLGMPPERLAAEQSAGGLRGLIDQLTSQLDEELRRREAEEAELEARAAEKQRLLDELAAVQRRRQAVLAETEEDLAAARDTERQHAELAGALQELRVDCEAKEAELEKLREAARLRDGGGRDWARDGPEKDALVETKLRIAEAHEQLAQMRQQLWLNREGLKRQLAELQAEGAALRAPARGRRR
ncbi:unnamed protein product [Prorocentrum cordatum]|uniref:Centrosomal protein of 162 kDa n=1 Tax=Prorocentrum cordatum TaxID=2364126 RepID=A0ABN9VSJ2_9DINO|nr:unnamed protein product [Polarella glacialis]